jgi:hypothetical protein
MKMNSRSSLREEIKLDIKAAEKIRVPWWGLLCVVVVSLPIYWLFDHFGKLKIALPILNCIAVLAFAIEIKWNLRRRFWFWTVIAILAALHIPLILFVPWTDKWIPAAAIAGLDSLDLILMLAILSIVEKNVAKPKPTDSRAPPRCQNKEEFLDS